MTKKFTKWLGLAIAVLTASAASAQTVGGPDAFGYRWANNAAATNPAVYNWIEISQTGTRVTGLADDNFVGPFPMPAFTYYWNTFTNFTIGSNGFIKMGGQGQNIASVGTGFQNFPIAAQGQNVMGALLTDLTFLTNTGAPAPNAACFYQTVGTKFVVQFEQVPHWNANTPGEISGSNTFQIVLDAADSSVTYQYKQCVGPVYTGYTAFNKAGISGPVSGLGLNAIANRAAISNQAVTFRYPRSTTYSFTDVALNWVHNPESNAVGAFRNQDFFVKANVRNSGTTSHSNRVSAILIVVDTLGTIAVRDTVVFGSNMRVGKDTTIEFRRPVPAGTDPGVYTVQVSTRLTGDQGVTNNERTSKLVIVDSSSTGIINFGYDYQNPVAQKQSGSTIGMSFDLPFYPAQIVGVELNSTWPNPAFWTSFNINPADSTTPLQVTLYDGTALPSSATILSRFDITNGGNDAGIGQDVDTVGVFLSQGQVSDYNVQVRRTLANPVTVNQGRVYMGVEQPTRRTRFLWNALTYDTLTPTSNRVYEIVAGVWAPNRDRDGIEMPFRLHLKALGTVTSGPRAAQYAVVGAPYPNPATDLVRVPLRLRNAGTVTMRLISAAGNTVRTADLGTMPAGNTEFSMDLAGLPAGLYHCQVMTAEGAMSRKIQVR